MGKNTRVCAQMQTHAQGRETQANQKMQARRYTQTQAATQRRHEDADIDRDELEQGFVCCLCADVWEERARAAARVGR